ncbi:MAG TPA: hypothetical protein VGE38_08615 [Nocardioides sp.]|uniref:hypothetical protein n=1 Tax=Nocardioides sp. TaxID=35761 RepID=UPI002ED7746E
MSDQVFILGESDPGNFTVPQVLAALDGVDDAEVQRVVALETAGKARKGLLAVDQASEVPSEEERKGKRGHDDHGNVRPADGRWELHDPKDESKVVRTPKAEG